MKTVVITGASDGIGAAAARQLKGMGHSVVLVGRSAAKLERVALETGSPFHLADFSVLHEVARLAAELARYERIDVLANNAGGIMGAHEVTGDGFEKTFQVNHLAPFLLTRLLLDRLVASRASVIQTASTAANLWGRGLDIEDLQNRRGVRPQKAYGQAKLANILFTRELQRRHGGEGLSAVAFHPGVVRSNFASDAGSFLQLAFQSPLRYLFTITPERSARRLVRLAEGRPGKDWQPGEVYNGARPMPVAFADDGTVARRLWDESERMVAPYLAAR